MRDLFAPVRAGPQGFGFLMVLRRSSTTSGLFWELLEIRPNLGTERISRTQAGDSSRVPDQGADPHFFLWTNE